MINVRIENWNKEQIAKDIEEYEKEHPTNLYDLNVTGEQQKDYWLKIFLPSVLTLAVIVGIWFIAFKFVPFKVLRIIMILLSVGIGGGILFNRFTEMLRTNPLARAVLEEKTVYPEFMNFHEQIIDKTIVDTEVTKVFGGEAEDIPYWRLVAVELEDKDKNPSRYTFENIQWKEYITEEDEFVIDFENMIIYSPMVKEEDTNEDERS